MRASSSREEVADGEGLPDPRGLRPEEPCFLPKRFRGVRELLRLDGSRFRRQGSLYEPECLQRHDSGLNVGVLACHLLLSRFTPNQPSRALEIIMKMNKGPR